MPAYQSPTGGTIGALLRTIQEDKQNSPLAELPGNQPGSPQREIIQGPLQNVESPDSAHVMSIKPELSQGPDALTVAPPVTVPLNEPSAPGPAAAPVVAPVAPISDIGPAQPSVVAPQAPSTPSFTPSPATPNIPSPPSVPRANPVGVSLGSQVMPFAQSAVKGVSSSRPSAPTTPKAVPTPSLERAPVPTPTMALNAPRSNYGGQPVVQGGGFNPLKFLASILSPFTLGNKSNKARV